jgi:hypothetical protein
MDAKGTQTAMRLGPSDATIEGRTAVTAMTITVQASGNTLIIILKYMLALYSDGHRRISYLTAGGCASKMAVSGRIRWGGEVVESRRWGWGT